MNAKTIERMMWQASLVRTKYGYLWLFREFQKAIEGMSDGLRASANREFRRVAVKAMRKNA